MPSPLYYMVSPVKNRTIHIWLNDRVYYQWTNYMFRPIATIFRFDNFLAKSVLYNMYKPRSDVEISSSFYVLLLS